MRLSVLAAALAVLVALPACDFGSDAIGLTGTWEGQVTVGGSAPASYDVSLRLNDNGQSVGGTGTVGSATGDLSFSVSGGTFVGTNVTLPLYFASDPVPGQLAGALTNRDPGRIEGTFSGPSDLDGDVRIELVAR